MINPRSVKVVCMVILIILTGVFKNHVAHLFTVPLSFTLESIGMSYESLEKSLSFLAKDKDISFGLGIFFYYGIYLLLHFSLIHFLFQRSPVVRNNLMLVLLLLVIGLGVLTIIFKTIGLTDVGSAMYYMFNQLVGRPLILFLVEGGGLIYESINRAFES